VPIHDGMLAAVDVPGYYDLVFADGACRLAVAPSHCPLPARGGVRLWGTSLQIPSLRGARAGAFGGLGELADAVHALAALGCQAVAINPVHALFPGTGEDYSPYSPSSRTFLNSALADPALLGLPPLPPAPDAALIDWPTALPERLAALRASFAQLSADQCARFAEADSEEDPALQRHAIHDALYCHFRENGAQDWRSWPKRFRNPAGPAVRHFAEQNADEIAFHRYAQWLTREGLAVVQNRARQGGMAIGLIADLAVGVHPGGSDCWAMPEAMLSGLTIGAPPDPLGPLGQNWSISGYSPEGLQASGYRPWIAMLRAALRSAGGLRIDHAFGLARLWVIPEGGECADGAYLGYPFQDLVRLVTLEAHRANALIIAEDLGTAPPGFTSAVTERNMLGMRVLWFERAADHGFIGAQDYPSGCVAMTGTHDTPTVAGWWRGRDLDWADRLDRLPPEVDRRQAESIRDWDRGLFWSTIGEGQRPEPENPGPVVEAALKHIGRSPALLAIAPVEDLLAEAEQPNLPGTISEHPNWRRRQTAALGELLSDAKTLARISAIADQG
jgi:4-alpha-glucanotransferase